MNPRLTKEYRALRLPWLVGLAAGLAALDSRVQNYAIVAAFGCAALLAAMSIGNEFQQRTFALLLSQPCARRDLWREKLLILGMSAGTLGWVLFLSWGIAVPVGYPRRDMVMAPEVAQALRAVAEGQRSHDMAMAGILFLAVVCSAPLWTLVARSIIGGMVFSLAGALLVLLLTVQLGVEMLLGPKFTNGIPDSVYAWAWLTTGLMYSGACLLAGWRKFARLELKDAILGESTLLSSAAARKSRWWNWLRIRPAGSLRNLVRKELRLQRPAFVVAAVFSLCWLAALGLHRFGPERGYEGLIWVLAAVYIPLALALAASISLGEERTLGLAAWHLTLPVSARLQWLLKLAVGAAVAIGLGLVLPGLLAWATSPEARAGLGHLAQGGDVNGLLLKVLAIGTALWLFFVLSFWAATLLGNTMRAVLTAGLGAGALALCTALSGWLADKTGGLERGLLCNITAWRQLPLDFFHGGEAVLWGSIAGGLVLSVAALAQSLVQFRRPRVQSAVVVKCAALLLAIAFLAAFWRADFQVSASTDYSAPLLQEVSRALRAFPHTERGRLGYSEEVRITEMDLANAFPLSARAKRWLGGAGLYLSRGVVEFGQQPRRIERHGFVRIKFPNGRECEWDYGTWPDG
jgi:ABC-type multidrug transport system permease subunit